jgi:hypothetical protein
MDHFSNFFIFRTLDTASDTIVAKRAKTFKIAVIPEEPERPL